MSGFLRKAILPLASLDEAGFSVKHDMQKYIIDTVVHLSSQLCIPSSPLLQSSLHRAFPPMQRSKGLGVCELPSPIANGCVGWGGTKAQLP